MAGSRLRVSTGFPRLVYPFSRSSSWTSAASNGRAGMADEFFVLDGGGKVPGLAEIEKFCVDLLYDFAAR